LWIWLGWSGSWSLVPRIQVGAKVKRVVSGGKGLSVFLSGKPVPATVKIERTASSIFAMAASL
jgi:hypothetical protein